MSLGLNLESLELKISCYNIHSVCMTFVPCAGQFDWLSKTINLGISDTMSEDEVSSGNQSGFIWHFLHFST